MQDRYGTMADLARELGVSRAAVSKAFKRHHVQRSADGKYNLNYMTWLLGQKQDQRRSEGQRSRRGKPAGLNNKRLRREIFRASSELWGKAVTLTLARLAADLAADYGVDDETTAALVEGYLTLERFWQTFHELADAEFDRDPADLDFERPPALSLNIALLDEQLLDLIGDCNPGLIDFDEAEDDTK